MISRITFDERTHSVFWDSNSQIAEDLAVYPVYHKRSKHIEIEYYWVLEHVDLDGELGTAQLIHV